MSIKITASHKDGTICLSVNGIVYTYGVDAAKHAHAKKLMKHTPGKGLHYIKRNANWYRKES